MTDAAQQILDVRRDLHSAVAAGHPLILVKAPPGSGKTYLIREAAALLRHRGKRVAIAAQTNTQADDICRLMAHEFPQFRVTRFHGSTTDPYAIAPTVDWVKSSNQLPVGPCIVVGTTAKWGLMDLPIPFDVLLVDEAWQMSWSSFMLCQAVAQRFVMVGDPGQIDPVVTLDVSRWVTSRNPPHVAAPEKVLAGEGVEPLVLQLPVSRRLPADSVEAVQAFYDFEFGAYAAPGARRLRTPGLRKDSLDEVLGLLSGGSMAALTLATPPEGPPLEEDREVAEAAAGLVVRALERGVVAEIDGERAELTASDIGVCATHRVLNSAIADALPTELRGPVMVDTPERWQGLECKLMIAVHPVSSVLKPSGFDLETGRLCVMASRHKAGVVFVSRDHVGDTLASHSPSADQGVGVPDLVGRGHDAHMRFWDGMRSVGRVVRMEPS